MQAKDLPLLLSASRVAVHPSGTWAVVAISHPDPEEDSYPSQLWRIDLKTGELAPYTFGDHDSAPVFSPDGSTLAFIRQVDGFGQIARIAAGSAEPQILTHHPIGVSGGLSFSADSSLLAYVARVPEEGRYTGDFTDPAAQAPRHIRDFSYRLDNVGFTSDRPSHVFTLSLPGSRQPGARQPKPIEQLRITSGEGDYDEPVWLAGTDLLVRRRLPDELVTSLEYVQIAPDAASASAAIPLDIAAAAGIAGLSIDGATIGGDGLLYFLGTDLGESRLDHVGRTPALFSARLKPSSQAADPASQSASTSQTPAAASSEIEGPQLSSIRRLTDPETGDLAGAIEPAPRGVYVTRERRGTTEVATWQGQSLEPLWQGEITATALAPLPGGGLIATAATPDSPSDLWHIDEGAQPRQLTDLAAELRDKNPVFESQEIEAASADGYPAHGWYTTPAGDGPHPVLLLIHGGPHAQFTPTFFDEVQVYTQAGYAVVYANPRGSSGYGFAHARAIKERFGTIDQDDVLAVLDAALADERLDGARVGVLGGSYGGYLTAWLTTQTDRFAAAIVERGFLDPVSFVGSSDIGWYFPSNYVGTDPSRVAAQSPMAHLGQVHTPTLVIHSEHDWRCPVEQGQRWYVGLKRAGVETELLLFPGEGHELSRSGRPSHRIARFEHILAWWHKHLPVTAPLT